MTFKVIVGTPPDHTTEGELNVSPTFDYLTVEVPARFTVLGKNLGSPQHTTMAGIYDPSTGVFHVSERPLEPVGDELLSWLLSARLTFGLVDMHDGSWEDDNLITLTGGPTKEKYMAAKKPTATDLPTKPVPDPTPALTTQDVPEVEVKGSKAVVVRMGGYGVVVSTGPDGKDLVEDSLVQILDRESGKLSLKWKELEDARDVNYAVLPSQICEELPFSFSIGFDPLRPETEPHHFVIDMPFGAEGVNFKLDCGVAMLVAPTGWGKTVFISRGMIRALHAENIVPAFVSYVEPLEPTVLENSGLVLSSPQALLREIGWFLLSDDVSAPMIVDSLRAFVYGKSSGGTGKGGFDQLLYTQFTALNNLAVAAEKLLVLSLNPLIDVDDTARYREVADAVSSSVTTAMIGTQPRTMEVMRRGLSSKLRDTRSFGVVDLSTFEPHGRRPSSEDPTPGMRADQDANFAALSAYLRTSR